MKKGRKKGKKEGREIGREGERNRERFSINFYEAYTNFTKKRDKSITAKEHYMPIHLNTYMKSVSKMLAFFPKLPVVIK